MFAFFGFCLPFWVVQAPLAISIFHMTLTTATHRPRQDRYQYCMVQCTLCTAIFQSPRGALSPSADRILPERTLRFRKCDDADGIVQVKGWHRHMELYLTQELFGNACKTQPGRHRFSQSLMATQPEIRISPTCQATYTATTPPWLLGRNQRDCQEMDLNGAGEGNRTLLRSLEGYCITTMLRPPLGRQCHTPVFDVSARGECRK